MRISLGAVLITTGILVALGDGTTIPGLLAVFLLSTAGIFALAIGRR